MNIYIHRYKDTNKYMSKYQTFVSNIIHDYCCCFSFIFHDLFVYLLFFLFLFIATSRRALLNHNLCCSHFRVLPCSFVCALLSMVRKEKKRERYWTIYSSIIYILHDLSMNNIVAIFINLFLINFCFL